MNPLAKIIDLYTDGFRNMTVGKTLWTVIIIKLIIIFAILKLFFFPDILSRDYNNDADRASHVREQLGNRKMPSDYP